MRIIAGELRGRSLLAPKADPRTGDFPTRPMPDRVRVSLFSLLREQCTDAAVFDAFAGTGAIGLETISRGAQRCVFVEKDRRVADVLRRNIETLGVTDRCTVVVGDALGPGALARCPRPVHLIFFDPPYPLMRDPVGFRRVMSQFGHAINLLSDAGFAVLRTPWPFTLDPEAAPAPAPISRRGANFRDADSPAARTPARPLRPHTDAADDIDELDGDDEDDAEDAHDPHVDPDDALDLDPDETGETGADAADSRRPRVRPNLVLPNAQGPETHIYRHTAVHLYMKAPHLRKAAEAETTG